MSVSSILTPAKIEEMKRLVARAHETDAALDVLLSTDDETIELAGSDNDDAQEALMDALAQDGGALLAAANENARLRELLAESKSYVDYGSADDHRAARLASRIDRALASPTPKAGE